MKKKGGYSIMEEKIVKYFTEEEAKNVAEIAGMAGYVLGSRAGLLAGITGASAVIIVINFTKSVIKRRKTKKKSQDTKKES